MRLLTSLVDRIAGVEALDRITKPGSDAVRSVIKTGRLKDLLSGTWLEHPLHPLLTDIPIGSFTSTTVLDVVGGRSASTTANVLCGLGVASVVPTAAAGLADWSDMAYDRDQRVALVHAAANTVGVAFYAASMVSRARGRRGNAALLGLTGMGAMTVGGYLGGHLAFSMGVGPNAAAQQPRLREWTPAGGVATVDAGTATRVDVGGAAVLVDRTGPRIRAINDVCTHAGGPLHEGTVDAGAGCVTCPWHGSVFRLDDGDVVRGPATVPAPAYELRGDGSATELRRA